MAPSRAGSRHGRRLTAGSGDEVWVMSRDSEDGVVAEPEDGVEDPGLRQTLDAYAVEPVPIGDGAKCLGVDGDVVR